MFPAWPKSERRVGQCEHEILQLCKYANATLTLAGQQVPGTDKSQILSMGVQLLKQPTSTFMFTRTESAIVIQMTIVKVLAS